MIVLRLGADDLARCRFAISPLLETAGAVRALVVPGGHPSHRPWPLRLRDRPGRSVPTRALTVLAALMPHRGYTPDFLTPPPAGPRTAADEELARVATTPAELAVQEVRRSFGQRPVPPPVRDLLADPANLAERVAGPLSETWQRLVRPYWERIREVLDADISYRCRCLAQGGLEPLLADLHAEVRWDGAGLCIAKPATLRRDLRGEGLLLVPSVFGWPAVQVTMNPPWQPTLVYPARGVGALWEPTPWPAGPAGPVLARLLGDTRARLIGSLREPATTTDLARRHGLAPATVSHHLKVMQEAGLVAARRDGRWVWYERSPLGNRLLSAAGPDQDQRPGERGGGGTAGK